VLLQHAEYLNKDKTANKSRNLSQFVNTCIIAFLENKEQQGTEEALLLRELADIDAQRKKLDEDAQKVADKVGLIRQRRNQQNI